MQKRKSVDWLEFVFSRELRGIPLNLVRTDVGINYVSYNEYQAGRYTLFQNKHNGTWFFQWSGKECATFDSVKEIWKFAEWLGIGLADITIKRVDIAFDLAIEMPPIDREMVQCRAKVYSFTESNGVTHRFGKSPFFLNIYDKRAERQARRDDMWPHFLETSGFDDGPVIRFEFMCRGRKLKERGIQTAFDFADNLRELESYLVRDWFWIRKTKNRKGRIPSEPHGPPVPGN